MAVKKHTLTTRADKQNGVNGADLFLAPALKGKPTLSNSDVLDGKGGIDTISAFLGGTYLAPKLANIEIGIFSRNSTADMTLDMRNATAMSNITLKNFRSDATINYAAGVSSFSAINTRVDTFTLNGIDTTKVTFEKLNFSAALGTTVALNSLSGGHFASLDMTLKDSIVILAGNTNAATMTLRSNGSQGNMLILDNANPNVVKSLFITGAADLNILGADEKNMLNLTSFNAGAMSGDLKARIGGKDLAIVTGSMGNDELAVLNLGGAAVIKTTFSLQSGNDILDLRALSFNPAIVALDGGVGVDTLRVSGAANGVSTALGFETLDISNATGTYTLNGIFTSLSFTGKTDASGVVINAGISLDSIIGDGASQGLQLNALGGTTAKKAVVSLGDGDDLLDLKNLTLNSATQFFDGGTGLNQVSISGSVNMVGLFDNFTNLYISGVAGTYDLIGSDFKYIELNPAFAAATFNNLLTGTELFLYDDFSPSLTVNVANAATDQTESLTVSLNNGVILGSAVANGGLIAASLSNLQIASNGNAASTIYLSAIGSATDTASITISGNRGLTLNGTPGAANFIDTLNVNSTAGVNILGLGTEAFAITGALITGGVGNDTLIGGVGADSITAGAGDNKIYGSLGVDIITLDPGAGANNSDTLFFTAQTQSAYLGGDVVVSGFDTHDNIDIKAMMLTITADNTHNVAGFADGQAKLVVGQSVAFFDQATDKLYIDVNMDGLLNAGDDMEITLTGLNSFNFTNQAQLLF